MNKTRRFRNLTNIPKHHKPASLNVCRGLLSSISIFNCFNHKSDCFHYLNDSPFFITCPFVAYNTTISMDRTMIVSCFTFFVVGLSWMIVSLVITTGTSPDSYIDILNHSTGLHVIFNNLSMLLANLCKTLRLVHYFKLPIKRLSFAMFSSTSI